MKTIPGTDFELKVYERKGPPVMKNDREKSQRRALLAKVHIAKKEMCLKPDEYEMILNGFKVASSADLPIAKLEILVKYLKHLGWKPRKGSRFKVHGSRLVVKPEQIEALRKRARLMAEEMELAENRFAGLVKKMCATDKLEWCKDVGKLRRLLKVLGKIREQGTEKE